MRRPVSTTLASTFADFAHGLQFSDVPEAARRRAALHLLDTLAAGVAGSDARETARSRDALLVHAAGDTPIWGTVHRANPPTAALLNGIAAHAYELDDSGGCDHSGAVVVPAVLAAASVAPAPVDGPRLLTAIVIGYELGRRVQDALGGYDSVNDRGWHSTGTCGPFAAAAAAAHVLNLDHQRTTHAIGLAAAAAAGSWAFMAGGAMSKRLHAGHAARGGLEAALLARAGFTGPTDVFEAPWGGFLDLYRGVSQPDPAALTIQLGTTWQIEFASIKPHATCRSTHASIDALLKVRAGLGDENAITGVEVHTSQLIADMCGGADIDQLTTAQLSLPFALSVAAHYGRVGIDDVLAGQTDPRIAASIGRVQVVVDPDLSGGSALPRLVVHTAAGAVHTAHGEQPRGGWDNPLAASEIVAKARPLLSRHLSDSTSENLIGALTSAAPPTAATVAELLSRQPG